MFALWLSLGKRIHSDFGNLRPVIPNSLGTQNYRERTVVGTAGTGMFWVYLFPRPNTAPFSKTLMQPREVL